MKDAPRQLRQAWFRVPAFSCFASVLLLVSLSPANGQDIRGIEVCTAEKQMERRTSCLQANVEFLQQALMKLDREFRDRSASADRNLADAQAGIAALKSKIEQLSSELAQMKAAESNAKK
jgi:hypothetical protein